MTAGDPCGRDGLNREGQVILHLDYRKAADHQFAPNWENRPRQLDPDIFGVPRA